MKIKDLIANWNKFFFSETSPAPVCMFRIVMGFLILLSGLMLAPDLQPFFGHDAIISVPSVEKWMDTKRFSLLYQHSSDSALYFLYGAYILSALTLTLGFCTRFSAIVLYLMLTTFDHRDPFILNSGDSLMRMSTLFMIFAPCGDMFSIDALVRRNKPKPVRSLIWSQRFFQLQMTVVYAQAFITKLTGASWVDGTAIYYSSRLEEFFKLPIPFLFDYVWICKLLTWGSLLTECSLWTLVWIKELRPYVLLAGLLLHAGIDWTMNIPLFEYAMVSYYITFLPPRKILLAAAKVRNLFRPKKAAKNLKIQNVQPDLKVNAES